MIKIKTVSLAAACIISAKKDIRYYLNGVQILVRDDGAVHVRSTDGRCGFDDLMPEPSTLAPLSLVIPIDSAKLIAKCKKSEIEIVVTTDGRYECEGVIFKPVDGTYPDMDRVLPARDKSLGDKFEHYNFEILYRCQSAMRIATGSKRGVYRMQNTPRGGLMYRENYTYPRCVAMPLMSKAFEDN